MNQMNMKILRSATTTSLVGIFSLSIFAAGAVKADWSSTSTTQLVLAVDAAKGTAKAVSQNYAVSGAGLTAPAALNTRGAASPRPGLTFAPTAPGVAFNLNMETKTADRLARVDVDGGVLPAYSDISLDTDGTAGTLAGTVAAPTRGTATAGGPGTSATLVQSNVYSVFD